MPTSYTKLETRSDIWQSQRSNHDRQWQHRQQKGESNKAEIIDPIIDPEEFFLENDLESTLSRQNFEKYKDEIANIGKNSALRKIYDSCMDASQTSNPWLHFRLVFGKCYYQENRQSGWKYIIKQWTTAFLEWVFDKCSQQEEIDHIELFMMFMESLIAHHKSFNPKAD
jgi:CRISPR/Cas system CSM-associated protein Csm2 small subunit